MKKGLLRYATNDVFSVKSTFVEIPHFVRKDNSSQEEGIGNKGAALVPNPSFLPMSVIPIGASRNEESHYQLLQDRYIITTSSRIKLGGGSQ